MASSLAEQLSQNASSNANIFSTSKRRSTESYLFPASQAATHDLESIHFLAANAFLQLRSIQPQCRKYESALFSDAVKDLDRTLLTKQMNEELDGHLRGFLSLLGPWLMEGMVGKLLEWLVRRFRINEFNVQDVLALFFPYHESPHFAKMLSILHIKPQSRFSFLLPFKSAAKNLPRAALVKSMLQDTDLARFISSLLPSAYEVGHSHRTLVAFNIGIMHEYMVRCKVLDEGLVAFVVSALVEVLKERLGLDINVVLGSFVLLSTLSHKCRLSTKATKSIVGSVAGSAVHVKTAQFLKAAVAICEPQEELDHFGSEVMHYILQLEGLETELLTALEWVGSEKFVTPFIKGSVTRLSNPSVMVIIQSIIATPNVPVIILNRMITVLMHFVLNAAPDSSDTLMQRTLLSSLYQRYASVVQDVVEDLKNAGSTTTDAIDQLVISLSMASLNRTLDSTHVDMVVASTSADQSMRIVGINSIIETLSEGKGLTPADEASLRDALIARTVDTSLLVLQTLYAKPELVAPIFTLHHKAYLTTLAQNINEKTGRQIVRTQLSFLSAHFYPLNKTLADNVFYEFFFPFLLFVKSKRESTKSVWEIIEMDTDGMGSYELLQGCADDWRWQTNRPGGESIDVMARTNMSTSAKIAENVLASSNYDEHICALLQKMQDSNPCTHALAHLVARALLSRLSGEKKIQFASRALTAMRLETLQSDEDLTDEDGDGKLLVDDRNLGLRIVQKLTRPKTKYWLQTSILALLPAIPRPIGVILDWLMDDTPTTDNQQGTLYVSLMRSVYKLAHLSTSLPLLSIQVIRLLFLSLKDDCLVFLTGVFLRSIHDVEDESICVSSLCHSAAFIKAQASMDFQTILPSLVAAMYSKSRDVRQAALDCVKIMAVNLPRVQAVYKFDIVYGSDAGTLQYLDRPDLTKYLQSILEYSDHITSDDNYLQIFHQQVLSRTKDDAKSNKRYKSRVLRYFVSHICAINLPNAKVALLGAIEKVSNEVKTEALFPAIQDVVQKPAVRSQLGPYFKFYAELLVSSLDKTSAVLLNGADSVLWPGFISVVQSLFQDDANLVPRAILAHNLEQGLLTSLSLTHQVEVCTILLKIGARNPNVVHCKRVLETVIGNMPLIGHLLNSLQPSTNQLAVPAKKRVKVDGASADLGVDETLTDLTLFTELLATNSLPISVDVVSRLLETLNAVLFYDSHIQGDKNYIEQLLMTAIANVAEKITEISDPGPNIVRLEILVELIRGSDNTQTSHQALLLMATLARLAPDSVVHNVMPVFTFMGSNVFHRDDSFSFRVVQQTINSIVPVMVASLKRNYGSGLNLAIGSRDFLKIFTDAASHIPRHRRTNFFCHLVDSLGPDEFLSPVCILLIDKASNRLVRQSRDEVHNSLALPISILQRYTNAIQASTFVKILEESQRLASGVQNSESTEPTFLDLAHDEERASSLSTVSKRRCQALLMFIGHALQSMKLLPNSITNDLIINIVTRLVHLAALPEGSTTESSFGPVSKAARIAMVHSFNIMPASQFLKAVLIMVQSNLEGVQSGAFDLLRERLPLMKGSVRRNMTHEVTQIVDIIGQIISTKSESTLVVTSLKALKVVALSASSGEENSLANVITPILLIVQERVCLSDAIDALLPLVAAIGPRIIPHFRATVDQCVAIVKEGRMEDTPVIEKSLRVLQGLLASIPSFWGDSELTQVIKLVTQCYPTAGTKPSASMSLLIKSIAKRAPSKALLPSLCDMWPEVEAASRNNLSVAVAYFDLLQKSVRAASRTVILEYLRQLFKVSLDAFDLSASVRAVEATSIESQSISAFIELVVKLNEAAFRPLFRRLYDWAFAADTQSLNTRKIIFCRVYGSLLDYFQGLMTTYMSFLLQPFMEVLRSFSAGIQDDADLHSCIVDTLHKSFVYDEGSYWRDETLRDIGPILVEQPSVCIIFGDIEGKAKLLHCLVAMVGVISDDALLKAVNLNLLMHTRSDDAHLRAFALTCSEELWKAHGGKLLGFAAETMTFIAECAEDDNDLVVQESHKLKNAVESVAGNLVL